MVSTIQELGMRRGMAMLGVAVACGLVLVFFLGNGDDAGLGRRYSVHGRVMYKSQPVEIGRITFHPIDSAGDARDATGPIQDGYYTLSTLGDNDGALPGNYRVLIVSRSAGPSTAQPIVEGGPARQSDVIKNTRRAKDMIPAKYNSPRNSPLTREVKAESNRFDFELED